MIELSLPEARQLAVAAQLLDGRAPTTVTEVVRALGSAGDPVAALRARSAWCSSAGSGLYDVAEFAAALDRGEVFEYWAHIVPTSDYGIHRESMRRYRGDLTRSRYIREWLTANASFRRYVLGEIRRRGPLLSRDLEDRATVPWQTGGWNDGKSVGRMLDILWFRGEIAIVGRDGNERVWDAAESGCRATSRDWPHARSPARSSRWPAAQGHAPTGVRAAARRRPAGRRRGLSLARPGRTAVPARVTGLDGDWWVHRDVLERGRGEAARSSSRPSTGSSTTASARRSSSASATGSRCTSPRRSASSATTSSRFCAALS